MQPILTGEYTDSQILQGIDIEAFRLTIKHTKTHVQNLLHAELLPEGPFKQDVLTMTVTYRSGLIKKCMTEIAFNEECIARKEFLNQKRG